MKQSREKCAYFYEIIEECVEKLSSEKHHAVYEHEYKSDEQLKTRCRTERIMGASCFNKGINVTKVIEDMIYDSPQLMPWLFSNESILRIAVKSKHCGKKFLKDQKHNWNDGAIVCNNILLFLEKEYDKANCVTGIHILTCYLE